MNVCLQAGIPDPPTMSDELIRQKARERRFLEQLLDSRKLENYKIPVPIKAELRKYQQVSLSKGGSERKTVLKCHYFSGHAHPKQQVARKRLPLRLKRAQYIIGRAMVQP